MPTICIKEKRPWKSIVAVSGETGWSRRACGILFVVGDRDLVFPIEPAAEIDQLAAVAAEGEVGTGVAARVGVDWFFANGAEGGVG